MKCPFCQAIIQDDALFCTNCGKKLPESMTAPAPAPAQPVEPVRVDAAAQVKQEVVVPEVSAPVEKDDEIISNMRSHLDDRRRELSNAMTECEKLRAENEALSERFNALTQETSGAADQIEELKAKLAEKDEEIAKLKADLDGAQRLIGRQEQEKRDLAEKAAALTAAAAAAKAAAEEVPAEAAPAPVEEAPAPAAPASEEPAVVFTADQPEVIEEPDNEADLIDEPTQSQVIGAYSSQIEEELREPVPPAEPAVQQCPNCGSLMPPENRFCTNCGTRLR